MKNLNQSSRPLISAISLIFILCIFSSRILADTRPQIEDESPQVAVEKGLSYQFNSLTIPLGELQFMRDSPKGLVPDKSKSKEKIYPEDIARMIEAVSGPSGPVSHTEIAHEYHGAMRKIMVQPTPKGLKLCDEKFSTKDQLIIIAYDCAIQSIVKNIEYKHPNLPQSDDFRLLVGTYRKTPRKHPDNEMANKDDSILKFRALVKVNPFTKKYIFQIADWGNPDEGSWRTENIK